MQRLAVVMLGEEPLGRDGREQGGEVGDHARLLSSPAHA
jgi:hypothetical protein